MRSFAGLAAVPDAQEEDFVYSLRGPGGGSSLAVRQFRIQALTSPTGRTLACAQTGRAASRPRPMPRVPVLQPNKGLSCNISKRRDGIMPPKWTIMKSGWVRELCILLVIART